MAALAVTPIYADGDDVFQNLAATRFDSIRGLFDQRALPFNYMEEMFFELQGCARSLTVPTMVVAGGTLSDTNGDHWALFFMRERDALHAEESGAPMTPTPVDHLRTNRTLTPPLVAPLFCQLNGANGEHTGTDGVNWIEQLTVWTSRQRTDPPNFTVFACGPPHDRAFNATVEVAGLCAYGVGPRDKIAKANAAKMWMETFSVATPNLDDVMSLLYEYSFTPNDLIGGRFSALWTLLEDRIRELQVARRLFAEAPPLGAAFTKFPAPPGIVSYCREAASRQDMEFRQLVRKHGFVLFRGSITDPYEEIVPLVVKWLFIVRSSLNGLNGEYTNGDDYASWVGTLPSGTAAGATVSMSPSAVNQAGYYEAVVTVGIGSTNLATGNYSFGVEGASGEDVACVAFYTNGGVLDRSWTFPMSFNAPLAPASNLTLRYMTGPTTISNIAVNVAVAVHEYSRGIVSNVVMTSIDAGTLPLDVNVTNASIPVTVASLPTVTGTVAVSSVSGTSNVVVTNQPSVSVVNQPAVTVANVTPIPVSGTVTATGSVQVEGVASPTNPVWTSNVHTLNKQAAVSSVSDCWSIPVEFTGEDSFTFEFPGTSITNLVLSSSVRSAAADTAYLVLTQNDSWSPDASSHSTLMVQPFSGLSYSEVIQNTQSTAGPISTARPWYLKAVGFAPGSSIVACLTFYDTSLLRSTLGADKAFDDGTASGNRCMRRRVKVDIDDALKPVVVPKKEEPNVHKRDGSVAVSLIQLLRHRNYIGLNHPYVKFDNVSELVKKMSVKPSSEVDRAARIHDLERGAARTAKEAKDSDDKFLARMTELVEKHDDLEAAVARFAIGLAYPTTEWSFEISSMQPAYEAILAIENHGIPMWQSDAVADAVIDSVEEHDGDQALVHDIEPNPGPPSELVSAVSRQILTCSVVKAVLQVSKGKSSWYFARQAKKREKVESTEGVSKPQGGKSRAPPQKKEAVEIDEMAPDSFVEKLLATASESKLMGCSLTSYDEVSLMELENAMTEAEPYIADSLAPCVDHMFSVMVEQQLSVGSKVPMLTRDLLLEAARSAVAVFSTVNVRDEITQIVESGGAAEVAQAMHNKMMHILNGNIDAMVSSAITAYKHSTEGATMAVGDTYVFDVSFLVKEVETETGTAENVSETLPLSFFTQAGNTRWHAVSLSSQMDFGTKPPMLSPQLADILTELRTPGANNNQYRNFGNLNGLALGVWVQWFRSNMGNLAVSGVNFDYYALATLYMWHVRMCYLASPNARVSLDNVDSSAITAATVVNRFAWDVDDHPTVQFVTMNTFAAMVNGTPAFLGDMTDASIIVTGVPILSSGDNQPGPSGFAGSPGNAYSDPMVVCQRLIGIMPLTTDANYLAGANLPTYAVEYAHGGVSRLTAGFDRCPHQVSKNSRVICILQGNAPAGYEAVVIGGVQYYFSNGAWDDEAYHFGVVLTAAIDTAFGNAETAKATLVEAANFCGERSMIRAMDVMSNLITTRHTRATIISDQNVEITEPQWTTTSWEASNGNDRYCNVMGHQLTTTTKITRFVCPPAYAYSWLITTGLANIVYKPTNLYPSTQSNYPLPWWVIICRFYAVRSAACRDQALYRITPAMLATDQNVAVNYRSKLQVVNWCDQIWNFADIYGATKIQSIVRPATVSAPANLPNSADPGMGLSSLHVGLVLGMEALQLVTMDWTWYSETAISDDEISVMGNGTVMEYNAAGGSVSNRAIAIDQISPESDDEWYQKVKSVRPFWGTRLPNEQYMLLNDRDVAVVANLWSASSGWYRQAGPYGRFRSNSISLSPVPFDPETGFFLKVVFAAAGAVAKTLARRNYTTAPEAGTKGTTTTSTFNFLSNRSRATIVPEAAASNESSDDAAAALLEAGRQALAAGEKN